MIDTHCHLTFDKLSHRLDEVFADAKEMGVDRMITVGTSPANSRVGVELAEKYAHVWATIGLHPCYSGECLDEAEVKDVLTELVDHPKVAAFGEMGLDKHWDDPAFDIQERAFGWQLEVVKDLPQIPIVIHNRKATDETLSVLRNSGISGDRFVFHCFTGEVEEFDQILDFGAMVSFTGVCTFKSAKHLAECAGRMPLDRLMIETDSPYLTPEPYRKVHPNEPKYVSAIAEHLAGVRGMSLDDFVTAVDGNADRFFSKLVK